ncbi:MAG: flagellar hook-length control protein FliK [Planctomycetota bacterium]|jgi:flagellar hook-length control protein FliK
MPTPLPTLDSALAARTQSDLRSPERRTAARPLPAGETRSFARTLKAKRDVEPDRETTASEPGPRAEPRRDAAAVDDAAVPAGDARPAPPVEGSAQASARNAQESPPSPVGVQANGGPSAPPPANLATTSTIEASGPLAVGDPAGVGADRPAQAAEPLAAAPRGHQPASAPAAAPRGHQPASAPAAPRPTGSPGTPPTPPTFGALTASGAPTPGEIAADQFPKLPVASPETLPEIDRPDGEARPRAGVEPAGRPVGLQDPAAGRNPALGRAMHVQAAVHVENATGQAPIPEMLSTGGPPASSGVTVAREAVGELPAQSTAGGPLATADPANDQFAARVLRGLGAMLKQRGGVMTMRLQPPDLGQLRVQMTIARGVVTAQFQPSTPEAQALLDRSLTVLRSALESHGLAVERLTVQTMPPGGGHAVRDDAADEQPRHERDPADAGQGRSRGRGDDHQDRSQRGFAAQVDREIEAFDLSAATAGADSP